MSEGFFGVPRLNRNFDASGCEIDSSGNLVDPHCSGGDGSSMIDINGGASGDNHDLTEGSSRSGSGDTASTLSQFYDTLKPQIKKDISAAINTERQHSTVFSKNTSQQGMGCTSTSCSC